jgi:hypothetical protein
MEPDMTWKFAGAVLGLLSIGCTTTSTSTISNSTVLRSIERFSSAQSASIRDLTDSATPSPASGEYLVVVGPSNHEVFRRIENKRAASDEFTLGMIFAPDELAAQSQPTASSQSQPGSPANYWRPTLSRQMGGEFKELITRDLWHGFKTVFWDVENEAVLLTTLGASIAIRETGVDDAVRRRTEGEFKLGDLDETIQIIGNPSTHFIGTGVLWLGSAVTKDLKEHEVAQSLTQALCVNGITTMVLKLSTNTRAPDTDNRAWPSGHTSSAFTVAAVVNEYYGPVAGIPSLALAGLVGYQRIDSRVHDFSDVVFGAMLGYVVGTSIAKDQKAEFPELFGMKVIPYSDPQTGTTGLALWKSW